MISLVEVVLAFAWTFGANGFLIERQLAEVAVVPAAWWAPMAARGQIVFHGRDDWAMAFYDESVRDTVGPRVALFAPYYLAPDGLVPATQMSVDVAEHYFHALLEATLDFDLDSESIEDASGHTYSQWVSQRAVELKTDVPMAHRRSAYIAALADFGAHLLSIRTELARLGQRQTAAGRDICRLIDQSASLFGLWQRSLRQGHFAGGYLAGEGFGRARWIDGLRALELLDKERFLSEILGVTWSGDPRRDFHALCPAHP